MRTLAVLGIVIVGLVGLTLRRAPYRPHSWYLGGYSESFLQWNVARIEYGSFLSTDEISTDMTYLRAAEIAKERGFVGFRVENERSLLAYARLTVHFLNSDASSHMEATEVSQRLREKYHLAL